MLLTRPSLIFLFLLLFFIQLTVSTVSTDIQHLDSDDIATLPKQIPSMIDKIGETLRRFRCPKGWKRFGGSCYYFPNVTSLVSHVNYSCNSVHSNRSNLLQIRNAIQLFYAAYVLSTNNLQTLVIEFHPKVYKGKYIAQMLMKDKYQWEELRNKFHKIRVKYNNLTKTILRRLNAANLYISRRSKQINPQSINDKLNSKIIHNSSVNEYEYHDFNASDDDEFEYFERIRDICDDIHWNVVNDTHNTTVYILSKYYISNKTVCSLTDVEPDMEYYYVCEYVLDYCIGNVLCGKHGHCVNTLSNFKCTCSLLYGDIFCEELSSKGIQLIIAMIFIGLSLLGLYVIPFTYKLIKWIFRQLRKLYKRGKDDTKQKNGQQTESINMENSKNIDRIRNNLVGSFIAIILSIMYAMTTLKYYKSFHVDSFGIVNLKKSNHIIKHSEAQCHHPLNYLPENLQFGGVALLMCLVFSCFIRRKSWWPQFCNGRPGLLLAIHPFFTKSRFISAAIFGLIAFQISKIFETLIFNIGHGVSFGVVLDLLITIGTVVSVGIRYYPLLSSVHLHNFIARCVAFLYIIVNIINTVEREGSCLGNLPLFERQTIIEEAKLRIELGSWFILYGSLKNFPHFFFLSYIAAEFAVRVIYDSIYISWKNDRIIWFAPPDEQIDDEKSKTYGKDYVTKLLKNNLRPTRMADQQEINTPHEIDTQQDKSNQVWYRKLINYVYEWDEDFRFTTLFICTYTTAIVIIYYLACTFLFLYLSRAAKPLGYIKSYIESSTDKELGTIPFIPEIIVSGVLTIIIYGIQILLGIKQFQKDKKALLNRSSDKILLIKKFNAREILSNSLHYPGFLIGYMAWSFVLCFHLILFIAIGIRYLRSQRLYVTIGLNIFVPIIIPFVLKTIIEKLAAVCFFEHGKEKQINDNKYKNYGIYPIFLYFTIFADCFLGISSILMRLITPTLAHIFFVLRLDCTFFGRPVVKLDSGYIAYLSYLRMELQNPYPVESSFISLCRTGIEKRQKTYYDDQYEDWETPDYQQKEGNFSLNVDGLNPINNDSKTTITHDIEERQTRKKPTVSFHSQYNDWLQEGTEENYLRRNKYNKTYGKLDFAPTQNMLPSTSQIAVTITTNGDQRLSDCEYGTVPKTITHRQISLEHGRNPSRGSKQKSSLNLSLSSSEVFRTSSANDIDGEIDINKTIQRKENGEEKKLKNNEVKKEKTTTKARDSINENDDDDGITKQKNKTTKTKTKKRSLFIRCFQEPAVDDDNEDDDDVLVDETSQADKKEQISDVKRRTSEDTVDNGRVQKGSFEKQLSNKSNSSNEEFNGNKVGRRAPKKGGIDPVVSLSERFLIDNSHEDNKSIINNTNGAISEPYTPKQYSISPSIGFDSQEIRVDIQNQKQRKLSDKGHYESIPTDEIHIVRTNSTESSSTSSSSKPSLSRTISNCTSQQHSSSHNQKGRNKHSNSHSKIKNDVHRLFINTPFQSFMKLIRIFSIHSPVPQPKQDMNTPEILEKKERILRKKRARTRWFLFYTLVHNPSLKSLRKGALAAERARRLRLEQTKEFDPQIFTPINSNLEKKSLTNHMKSEISNNRKINMTPTSTEPKFCLSSVPNTKNDLRIPPKQLIPIAV